MIYAAQAGSHAPTRGGGVPLGVPLPSAGRKRDHAAKDGRARRILERVELAAAAWAAIQLGLFAGQLARGW
jgi:hypothetical protein